MLVPLMATVAVLVLLDVTLSVPPWFVLTVLLAVFG